MFLCLHCHEENLLPIFILLDSVYFFILFLLAIRIPSSGLFKEGTSSLQKFRYFSHVCNTSFINISLLKMMLSMFMKLGVFTLNTSLGINLKSLSQEGLNFGNPIQFYSESTPFLLDEHTVRYLSLLDLITSEKFTFKDWTTELYLGLYQISLIEVSVKIVNS